MWLLGVADQKACFLAFVAFGIFKPRRVVFFDVSGGLTTRTTHRDAYISGFVVFSVDDCDNNNDDRRTDQTPCTCTRGKCGPRRTGRGGVKCVV